MTTKALYNRILTLKRKDACSYSWRKYFNICCVEVFYCMITNIVSSPLKFRIYEEMLTWTRLLFKIRIINFVKDIGRINNCCFDRKAILSIFMLTWRVKAWKLSVTEFTIDGNIGFRSSVLLSNAIIQIFMGLRISIGTLNATQCPKWSSLLVKSKIKLCSLGTRIFTFKFLVPIERRHSSDKSVTEYPEINVKLVATWL